MQPHQKFCSCIYKKSKFKQISNSTIAASPYLYFFYVQQVKNMTFQQKVHDRSQTDRPTNPELLLQCTSIACWMKEIKLDYGGMTGLKISCDKIIKLYTTNCFLYKIIFSYGIYTFQKIKLCFKARGQSLYCHCYDVIQKQKK